MISPGVYKHFKGNRYLVMCTATHSETCEQMVVYKALYGDGQIFVRPANMWSELVYVDNNYVKRFTRDDQVIMDGAVPHGYWQDTEHSYDPDHIQTGRCSVCEMISARPLGNCCKWCGAVMDVRKNV